MIASVKIYQVGRCVIPKPVREVFGLDKGDLVELQVPPEDGLTSTVPIRTTYRVTIPSQIRDELSLEPGDYVTIDVRPSEE